MGASGSGGGMGSIPSAATASSSGPIYGNASSMGPFQVKLWTNAFVSSATGKGPGVVDILGAYVGNYLVTYSYYE